MYAGPHVESRSNYEGGQTITEEEIAAFASLPDSVDDLEKMFTELQGQAAGISTQAGILQQFQQRAQRIEELAAQQQAQQAALDTAEVRWSGQVPGCCIVRPQAELAELQQQWLPELQRVVSVISGSFSESFRRVGCAGEVALVEPEDGDMAKFAIEIRCCAVRRLYALPLYALSLYALSLYALPATTVCIHCAGSSFERRRHCTPSRPAASRVGSGHCRPSCT